MAQSVSSHTTPPTPLKKVCEPLGLGSQTEGNCPEATCFVAPVDATKHQAETSGTNPGSYFVAYAFAAFFAAAASGR